jgi:hypothetical protein
MRFALVALVLVGTLTGCADGPPAAESPAPSESATVTPTPTPTPTADEAWATVADPTSFVQRDASDFGWDDSPEANLGDEPGVHFVSPSLNLGCVIRPASEYEPDGMWGCAAREYDWDFPDDSPDDFCYDAQIPCGGGIEVEGAAEPHPRYRGDPGFPAALSIGGDNQPPYVVTVLRYGESVSYGDVTCYSEERGVTCVHAVSGHGFTIARDLNTIF